MARSFFFPRSKTSNLRSEASVQLLTTKARRAQRFTKPLQVISCLMQTPPPISPECQATTRAVVDSALQVHRHLGPGLLESVYKACLCHELQWRGHYVQREVALPLVYRDLKLDAGLRLDLLVDSSVIVEIKAVDAIHPVHKAQLLSYLRLSERRVGLLINFHVELLKDGISRLIL